MRKSFQSGHISMISLLFAAVMMVAGLALLQYVGSETKESYRSCDDMAALSLAEAGVSYGLDQLRQNSGYTGTATPIALGDGVFTVSVSVPGGDQSRRIIDASGTVNGVTRQVRAFLTSGFFRFPNGAIVSNGNVRIVGSASTLTDPPTEHLANVHANRDVRITGSADIDGYVTASGTVTITGSVRCLGQQNGAPQVQFPNEEQVSAWESEWRSIAMSGTHYCNITLTGSQTMTLTAPCYISGRLKAAGSATFNISGSGVVFVEGDIQLTGSSKIRNSAILVAKGTIDITGSHGYVATGSPNTVALVSLSTASSAIRITGSGTADVQGFIYAARGGIDLTGSDVVKGAVIAWGDITKTGSSVVHYPASLNQNLQVLPGSFNLSGWQEF